MINVKNHTKSIIVNIARYVFLLAFSYVLIYPLFYMISGSFKSLSDFFDPTVEWIPKNFVFENFKIAANAMEFGSALKNTLLLEILSAIIEIISCMIAAYGLARFNFKGKKALEFMMLLTIFVPTAMIIIPSYMNYSRMDVLGILSLINKITGIDLRANILDTYFVMWLPSIFAVGIKGGLFIYIYKQFFQGLPREFEEAAYIDGAGPVKTFLRVIVPASGVPIVTVSMFSVVWHWNDYYVAAMYMSKKYPLSVQLSSLPNLISSYMSTNGSGLSVATGPILLAGCLMTVIPLLIFYVILQRRFIASIANSGIVG